MAKNNNLTDFLTSLANKIRNKLGSGDLINPQDFEDKIDAIDAKKNQKPYIDTSTITDFSWFCSTDTERLSYEQLKNVDTSNGTNFRSMFNSSPMDKVPAFDLRHAVTLEEMFSECDNLTTVEGDRWDLTNCENASDVFYACPNLTTIPELHFGNSIKNISCLLEQCPLVEEIAIYNTASAENFYRMLYRNTGLKRVKGEIDFSSATNVSQVFGTTTKSMISPYFREVRFAANSLKISIDIKAIQDASRATIESCIGCLDNSVNGNTVTINKSNVNKEFETSEGALDGSISQDWLDLVATKPNWTITLG